MNRFACALLAAVTLTLPATYALADFDVSPSVSGGKIITNAYTDEGPSEDNNYTPFVGNVRVFDFGFDDTSSVPYFTQDPGFHPQPDTSGFTPASTIRVGAVSGLSYFAGGSDVSFSAAPSAALLTLSYGSGTISITSSGATSNLLNLGQTDASGEFDNHLESRLSDPGNASSIPSDGIYLVSLQLSETGTGLTASDPFYVVYAVNASDDDVDAAKTYLRDTYAPGTNLAPAVPEPAALAVVSPVGILMMRRRR